jgi:hypothetical protein
METQRLGIMVDKLVDQVARGCIDNDWVETFVADMSARLKRRQALTPKQAMKVEELFEQY